MASTIQGQLRMLGSSTAHGELIKYSVIQVGDVILTDIMINKKLDNFLRPGLATSANTKLWLLDQKTVMAVQIGAGQRAYSRISPAFLAATVFCLGLACAAYSLNPWFGLFSAIVFGWMQWRPIVMYFSRIPGEGGVKI